MEEHCGERLFVYQLLEVGMGGDALLGLECYTVDVLQ
jgi:hypothetical protein